MFSACERLKKLLFSLVNIVGGVSGHIKASRLLPYIHQRKKFSIVPGIFAYEDAC